MLKYYKYSYEITENKKNSSFFCDKEFYKIEPEHDIVTIPPINITWDNIKEVDEKYNLPLVLVEKEKGYKLRFYSEDFFIKSWKNPLDVTLSISIKEVNPMLKDLFNYENADLAIQYISERMTLPEIFTNEKEKGEV